MWEVQREPVPFSLPEGKDGPNEIASLEFGKHHIAFVTTQGKLFMMGQGTKHELGLGDSITEAKVPTEVEGFGPVVQVKCGEHHTIALTADGKVWTWGDGGSMWNAGALGHGNNNACPVPTEVTGLTGKNIVAVQASHHHCLALSGDGKVFTWGRGEYGVLGTGASTDVKEPVLLESLAAFNVVHITCGNAFSGAITDEGELWVWGRNDGGQLGQPEGLSMDIHNIETVPTQCEVIKDLKEKVIDVACGERHTLALTAEGETWMWGLSQWLVPELVRGDDNVLLGMNITQIAACNNVSAVVDEEGYLFTWGHGVSGCLGQGGTKNVLHPLMVEHFGPNSRFGPVKRLFAGNAFVAVLTD